MSRPQPTQEQLQALWDRVTKYVDEVELSCEEDFCQRDRPQIEAYDLVPDIAEIVGFYEEPGAGIEPA